MSMFDNLERGEADTTLKAILELVKKKNEDYFTELSADQIDAIVSFEEFDKWAEENWGFTIGMLDITKSIKHHMIPHQRKGRSEYEEILKEKRQEEEEHPKGLQSTLGLR